MSDINPDAQIWQSRTGLLLGSGNMEKLRSARVAVVGVGGVGGYAAEMLARAGVGHLVLVDSDDISESNINRQILALHSTIGRRKVDVLRERLLDINPDLEIICIDEFLCEENLPLLLPLDDVDCVVDAIDTLSPKIALIQHCLKNGTALVSSMGSGAKMDATAVRIADISGTRQCPLAHMLRKRLHKLGIYEGFDAVFSAEPPMRESLVLEEGRNKKSQVGSISYIPAVFGCACAQAAVGHIIK
ncbi:MAG: tRNA threonylcarbamoyladenosine dehydratase [Bacteroidales bacterium]|nr:tRNA threonylcarbamoyladenosine dehydratase [Bacteroidales bacterium]